MAIDQEFLDELRKSSRALRVGHDLDCVSRLSLRLTRIGTLSDQSPVVDGCETAGSVDGDVAAFAFDREEGGCVAHAA